MDSTLKMILQMSGAALLYVVITAGLWALRRKKDMSGWGWTLLIGLIYGACSVTANHIGIPYEKLILNVRDIGPLAAGLFFSPGSGIIAGIIGGAERILAGELWNIGRFTELACGMSTFLAGVLAAALNKFIYEGERPTVTHSFFLGAVMEVFHMYAVLFTNRDEMTQAYTVVRMATLPMIVFTAIGLALCSMAVARLSGEKLVFGLRVPEEKLPITVRFQRGLLLATGIVFLFSLFTSYSFQTRLVQENASAELSYISFENARIYEETSDLEMLKRYLSEQVSGDYAYLLANPKTGKVQAASDDTVELQMTEEDMELISGHIDQKPVITRLNTFGDIEMLCSFQEINPDCWLLLLRPTSGIYETRDAQLYEDTLSDILIFTVLFVMIAMLAEDLVVSNLNRVNSSLERITNGKLDEEVWVHTSTEFTELSEHINKTVTALRGYIEAAGKKMEEELKLAAAIQDSALPKNFELPSKGIEIYALMVPAKQVGGDFYDFFYISRELMCLVIADVSGKGIPASLFMMRAKTAIKNYARGGNNPGEVLEKVNHTLCEGNDAEMFVTVWLGILNLKTGQLSCANAGHEYPVMMRAGGDYELVKDRHGLVLAAMDGIPMKGYELQMNPGDRLFVYTDGVPEAINEKEEAYGTERLVERLNKLKDGPQERTLKRTLQDIRNFAGTAEQFDDITMLGLTYCPEQAEAEDGK